MIELPTLPIPSPPSDPRHEAIAATVDELERLGVAHVTILVAGGLFRRPVAARDRPARPARVPAPLPRPADRPRRRGRGSRRARHGRRACRCASSPRARRDRPRRDGDRRRDGAPRRAVGAPARVRRARRCARRARRRCSRRRPRRAGSSRVELERLLAARAPRLRRLARAQPAARLRRLPVRGGDRSSGSRARGCGAGSALLPAAVRGGVIERVPRELTAAAVFGGTPSAAHTEALLRAIEFKGDAARRAARRDRDRHPADDAVRPARAPEPGVGRLPRARARAAALAQRLPGARRRHGDPAPRLPAPLPRPDADAVPRALRRPAHGPRPRRAARGRAGGARRRRARSPTTARAAPSIRSSRS